MYSFMGIWAALEDFEDFEVIAILRDPKNKQKNKKTNKDSRWKQTTYFVVEQEPAKQVNYYEVHEKDIVNNNNNNNNNNSNNKLLYVTYAFTNNVVRKLFIIHGRPNVFVTWLYKEVC